jgi:hypothetical protein
MKISRLLLCILLASALLRTWSASAVVAYTTLDNSGGYDFYTASAINGSASGYGYQAWANKFVVTTAGSLSSIEIGVHYAPFLSSPAEQVNVRVAPNYVDPMYLDVPAATSLVSGSVFTPTPFGSTDLVNFTPSTSVTLVPGEIYWLVITPYSPNTMADWCRNSIGVTGLVALSLGSQWLPNPSDTQNAFRVNVEPIPEPSSCLVAFLGLGLLILGSAFRR